MSTQFNLDNNNAEYTSSQSKVKVTDLLSRLNEEKKIEKKRNLALGVAAVSAVTVFGIIPVSYTHLTLPTICSV